MQKLQKKMNILDIGLIGLDFGSSKTVISILRKGALEIILNECSLRETHNIVAFTDKETLVGDQAFMKLKSNYKNTILYPSRYLNSALTNDPSLFQKEASWQPATLKSEKDAGLIFEVNYLGKIRQFSPIQILAFLFGFYAQKIIKASKFVFSQYGFVIAVPAYFTPEERVLLSKSAQISSTNLLKILNESAAVGLIYKKIHDEELLTLPNGKRVLFIDVGFSKTGVFLINFLGGNITIIHEIYDRYLGLREIDNMLLEFYQGIIKKSNPNYQENFKMRLRVLEGIEKQRKMLSANNDAPIIVESLFEDYDLNYTMNRQDFESLINPVIEKMKSLFLRFKVEGELFGKNMEIDEVEIIGGGIRIPIIQKIIMESFNQNALAKTLNATECIAMGSALYCNKIAGIPTNPPLGIINELLYHSIYCGVRPKGIDEILVFMKGVGYPSVTTITIPKDNEVKLVVFYYKIDDKVYPLYEINMENENNGVLSIQAGINDDGLFILKDLKINENKNIINYNKDLNEIVPDETLNKYRSEYEAIVKHDKMIQESYEMKNKMESYIYAKREDLLTKYKAYMKENDISSVQTIFQDYEHWLYNHDDSQSKKNFYEAKMKELQDKIEPIFTECYELHEMDILQKNEITTIGQLKNLVSAHKTQPFVDKLNLNLNNQKIGDGGGLFGYFKDGMSRVKQYINSLKIQDNLRLDLRNNSLSDSSLEHLIEIIENQRDVKSLHLLLNNEENKDGKNQFSDKIVFKLCEGLRNLTKMKSLKLIIDNIDEINFKMLMIGLENLKGLESVEMKLTKGLLSQETQNNFYSIKTFNKSIRTCKLECGLSEKK